MALRRLRHRRLGADALDGRAVAPDDRQPDGDRGKHERRTDQYARW